ncbi:MAG: hypothetical protein HY283_01955 [Nitrospirae bacterium]|nr:hypothetical protein [Nitrospirota bacterium]
MGVHKRGSLIFLALFLLIGCGKANNTNTHIQEGKSGGSILVNVSDGNPISRPIYTWSDINNDITAMKVTVARTSALSTPVWEVSSPNPSVNAVQSPIQHATTESGTTQTANSELDLQTDIWYRVTVTKADILTSGFMEFMVLP